MIKCLSFIFFFFSSTLCATSHWNEEQVADYVHYSELQRRSSWHLLSQLKFKGDEKVLDVGCGDGRNTAWMAWLVRSGSVIGIDPSNAMLCWAKKQYHPAEFPNLTFALGDANHLPEGKFDIIASFFSLHIVKEKQAAIQGFFNQLTNGGYVIAVIPPGPKYNPKFTEAIKETMESDDWSPYFKDFQSTFRFETLEDYKTYFQKAGFTSIEALYVPSIDPFVTTDEFVGWFMGTWPHFHYLPKELRRVFVNQAIEKYIQKRPTAYSQDGVLSMYWGFFELIAQK